jgi:hypothetical protein
MNIFIESSNSIMHRVIYILGYHTLIAYTVENSTDVSDGGAVAQMEGKEVLLPSFSDETYPGMFLLIPK